MRILTALIGVAVATADISAGGIEISVLSGRADMVTGGDALVRVSGISGSSLKLMLNGEDVAGSLRPDPAASGLVGRVSGLKDGDNALLAETDGESKSLKLVNYPRSGPVFSGPHQKPFICGTERAGLGEPIDEDCSVETRVEYYYRSTERVEPIRSAAGRAGGFEGL